MTRAAASHCSNCNADLRTGDLPLYGRVPCPNCGLYLFYLNTPAGFRSFENQESERLQERIIDLVSEQLGIDRDKLANDAAIINELGADSLDVVELVMELEDEFDL